MLSANTVAQNPLGSVNPPLPPAQVLALADRVLLAAVVSAAPVPSVLTQAMSASEIAAREIDGRPAVGADISGGSEPGAR